MKNDAIMDDDLTIGPSQVNDFGDRSFYNINQGTFSKISATALFDATFEKSLFKTYMLYIVMGTDSGLLPCYIQKKGIPAGTRYVFIEPEKILRDLKSVGALDDSAEEISYTDENTWIDVVQISNMKDYFYIDAVSFVNALSAQDNAMEAYAELSWIISEKIQQLKYQLQVSISTEPFIVQQVNNFADSIYPAQLLRQKFKEKTAVVLGGGPSLDDILPWVKEHRDYVVVVAVSRIARRLIEVEIEPDFIVSVDPFVVNFDVSKYIFSLSSKSVFIHGNHVLTNLVSTWAGRSLYLGARVPWDSALNEENISSAGPTVSNTAVAVAAQFGFKRIFLAGVDFCYTVDGYTHAKGSNEYAAGARFHVSGAEVKTYAGTMAPVNLGLSFARDVFEQQVKSISNLGQCQIFNTAIVAAEVKGVEHIPTASIVLDKEPVIVEEVLNKYLNPSANDSFFSSARKELKRALYQLNAIDQISQEALDINASMYNEEGIIEHHKDTVRMNKLEQLLRRKHSHFSRLVKAFGVRSFLQTVKQVESSDAVTAEEIQRLVGLYYESYKEGTTRLIKLLKNAEAKVIAREEERKKNPDWALIIEQCRQEQSYGRVHIWKKLESAKNLPEEFQKVFEEFEQKFSLMLKGKGHETAVKKLADFSSLKARAHSLFKHKKLELLQNVLLAVDKHQDAEGVVPYRYWIQGYIAELEGDKERAFAAYQQVIEHGSGPLEEALVRIVHLDIEHNVTDLTHQALGCLAQLNARYIPMYAESCRIRGDNVGAVDAYSAYLMMFPDDIVVQLKMVRLYLDQKIYDGAKMMLDHILLNDPEQETALILMKQLQESLDALK